MLPRFALGLAILIAAGCGDPTPPKDVNLLLVSWDTLRADRLGAYGNADWDTSPSPRADALGTEGVLFETAYAPRGQTHPSLASMLTGLYPATTGLRENGFPLPPEHTTLFERLDAAGYQTGVFISNFVVQHPVDGWVARGADVAADGYGGSRGSLTHNDESRLQVEWDNRVERATSAYLEFVDKDKPFAVWTHFYDVHKPYNPPQGYIGRFGKAPDLPDPIRAPGPNSAMALEQYLADITLGRSPEPSEQELKRIQGLYDGAVRATDDRLSRILNQLEEMGELENTYVVFTSDHGEELYDHNRYFYHGASIYDGVVRIPLIISGPELQRGLRVSGVVRNIDIAPTVLDLLGLPEAPEMEGTTLAPVLRGEASEPAVDHAIVEWQDLIYAASDGKRKLILNRQHVFPRKSPYHSVPGAGFDIDCIEAYDLLADPLEQVNLLQGFELDQLEGGRGLPEEFQPLYFHLRDFLADPAHEGSMNVDSLDAQARKRLSALGYVGTGSTSAGRRTDSMRGDPCVQH
jgi:arylsulfatase A-like enzyme